MAAYFLDSSALVKRYVTESGTAWVQSCVDPVSGNRVYVAQITSVEVTSASARRRRGGTLTVAQAAANLSQFRHDLASDFLIVEITPPLIGRAMVLADRYTLRAYDAVQLAAAERASTTRTPGGLSILTLMSADQDLNAAAASLGIPVDDPNTHP